MTFTRDLADIKPTLPRGRPRAVTPELEREGWRLLREERLGVRAMCDRLGVDQRSWYRATSRSGAPKPKRRRRHRRALGDATIKKLRKLRQQGLTLRAVAERLGLHLNTVFKYLRDARSDASQSKSVPTHPPT